MKIRRGFVSNSSSTSFCICGMLYDSELPEEIMNLIESYNSLKSELDPRISTYHDNDTKETYVGIDIENMENWESRREFVERCLIILKRVFPQIKEVYFHYGGWYSS